VFYDVRMGSVLCLLTVSLHTLHALSCEQLAPGTHEDMRVAPRIFRCKTQAISPASVLMVNTCLIPSESHENGF
jgi:hypothetical protein